MRGKKALKSDRNSPQGQELGKKKKRGTARRNDDPERRGVNTAKIDEEAGGPVLV